MDKGMAEELESKHAALHALIEEEEHRAHPDEDLLHRLKKEKLRLKDELAGHLTEAAFFVGGGHRSPPLAPGKTRRDAHRQLSQDAANLFTRQADDLGRASRGSSGTA